MARTRRSHRGGMVAIVVVWQSREVVVCVNVVVGIDKLGKEGGE